MSDKDLWLSVFFGVLNKKGTKDLSIDEAMEVADRVVKKLSVSVKGTE